MEIIIDGIDFWDSFKAEKYWSPTKNQNIKEIATTAIYSGNYTLSEKVDGDWRMLIKDMEGNFHLRGRSESVNGGFADKIEWIPHITEELKKIPNGTVVLGELYLDSKRGSRNVTTIMGCLKEKALARQEKNEKLSYYIFDILAYNGENLCNYFLQDRLNYFSQLSKYFKSKYVSFSKYINDPAIMEDYIAKLLEMGREGVVLKRLDGKYEQGKRTARKSIKVKKEIANNIDCFTTGRYKPSTIEYTGKEVQDWLFWQDIRTGKKLYGNHFDDYTDTHTVMPITKGHYYGWAGAIEIAVWRDGKEVSVGWISNVTEEVKKGIVEDSAWTHRVCEVQAMMIEEDTKALRHGKIMQWRDDKNWQDCDGHEIFG